MASFEPLHERDDTGALWENLMIVERMKKPARTQTHAQAFFRRTYTGAELDYVEQRGGSLHGYEFRWGAKKAKCPGAWTETYPGSTCELINRSNYLDFTTGP